MLAEQAMSVRDLSEALGIHRSVIYRLARTLQKHRLLTVGDDGRYSLGLGLLTLAHNVQYALRSEVAPILVELSSKTGATAIMLAAEHGESVCIASAEPPNAILRVRYREGSRHPIGVGAGGLAILAANAPTVGERPEIAAARERGYAMTVGDIEAGTTAIAFAVPVATGPATRSISALIPTGLIGDPGALAAEVIRAAKSVGELFGAV